MKSKLLLLVFCLVWGVPAARAQQFTWQSLLPPVAQAGYYRILLPPDVVGRSQPGLADLRLVKPNGQSVPYILRTEAPVHYKTLFRPYQILQYDRRPGGVSELLVHNPQKRTINNISLLIGNAEVQKQVSLSGSDDQLNWYVLKAQDLLYAIENTRRTAEVKLLDFPLSNYRYFRLQLQDSLSAPLNILQAGYYDTFTESGKYTRVPIASLSKTDSTNQTTYLRLSFGQPVYPEQLVLHISRPSLYHRSGQVVFPPDTAAKRPRKRRRSRPTERAVPLLLSSNAPATFALPRQRVTHLEVQLENGDNPPLTIDSVQVLQLNRYLVAALDSGQHYSLRYGDPALNSPQYDLHFFQDSIPQQLPLVTPLPAKSLLPAKAASSKSSKLLIWAALAVLALGLGYMTVRLLKEMERK